MDLIPPHELPPMFARRQQFFQQFQPEQVEQQQERVQLDDEDSGDRGRGVRCDGIEIAHNSMAYDEHHSARSAPIAIPSSSGSHSGSIHDIGTSFATSSSSHWQGGVAPEHHHQQLDGPLSGALVSAHSPLSTFAVRSVSPERGQDGFLNVHQRGRRRLSSAAHAYAPYVGSPLSPASCSPPPHMSHLHAREHGPRSRVVSAPHEQWRSSRSSHPRSPLANTGSHFSHAPTSQQESRARRSSLSSSAPLHSFLGAPTSPAKFQARAFIGSYENSLLAGKMGSARQSKPLPFSCALGVLGNGGAGNVPKRLRCPPHIHVDFEACFFEPPRASNAAAEGANDAGSPYVGTIDLDSFYFQHLERLVADDEKVTSGAVLPRFPGYEVPRAGQIQLCVKNQHSTAIKVFLIPYNLAGIERDGRGGRTFLRQKSHIVIGDRQEGGLRYAVHLQFCAPPPSASKLGVKEQQRYYLHRHIRVVFASQHALSPAEKLRVVAEGPQGVLDAKGSAPMKVEAFAPFKLDAHVLNAWNALRREAKLALKRQKGDVQPDDPMQVDKPAPSVKDVEMADVAESWKRYHAELSAPIDPNGAVSPNELAVAQQQRYTLNGSPLSHSPSMEAPPSEQATMSTLQRLDFARVSRPPTPSRAASPSQPSGLSMSRPSSRAETRILRTSTPDSSR